MIRGEKMDPRESYGKSEGYEVTPLNRFRLRYFRKNYEGIIRGLPRNGRLLEIGPGGGTFTEYLLECGFRNITLCEYSRLISGELAEHFRDRQEIKVISGDALLHLEDNPDTYDAIISQQVIEHFTYEDFVRLLSGINRSLKKGGVVILETNNSANIVYGMYLRYCDHTHRLGFTPRSLENFLETENLEVERTFPIHMTGLGDLALSVLDGLFSRGKGGELKTFNKAITSTSLTARAGLGLAFALRSIGILFSRFISFVLIYPYDLSLGAVKNPIFTPTFGIVARKREGRGGSP